MDSVTKPCLTLFHPLDESPPGFSDPEVFPGESTGAGCRFLLRRSPHIPRRGWTVLPSGSLQPRPPSHPQAPARTEGRTLCVLLREVPPVWSGPSVEVRGPRAAAALPAEPTVRLAVPALGHSRSDHLDLSEGVGAYFLPRTPRGADSAPRELGVASVRPTGLAPRSGHSLWGPLLLSEPAGETQAGVPVGQEAPALLTRPRLLSVPRWGQ